MVDQTADSAPASSTGLEPIIEVAAGTAENIESASNDLSLLRRLILGLFLIAFVCALYLGREFFMPVVLAFLIALTLTPIVRFLRKRGIPSGVSATFLVLIFAGAVGLLGYAVSGPAIELAKTAPTMGPQLAEKMKHFQEPLERLSQISHQIEEMTEANQPGVTKVTMAQTGMLSWAAGGMLSFITSAAITLVLAIFLLASGTMFYEKIVQSFSSMSEKKRALRVVYDVEREISRYLLTIAIINTGLGAAVATGMWAIGMPTPLLWGAIATFLNFLPYIGALTTMMIVAFVSLLTFDSLSYALLAPAFVLCCNIAEGQFITPLIVGRRLELNAVAIFLAVAFWSWLWGLIGALIAVPILVVIKVFCDHFESLEATGNFLAAAQTIDRDEEDAPKAATPAQVADRSIAAT